MKITRALTGLAALLVLGSALHAQAVSIYTIPSYPLWTDTGIRLNSGDGVSVTASGSWEWNFTVGYAGPDGLLDSVNLWDLFYSGAINGELIAYVGSDPTQGHRGDGSFFPRSTGYWAIGSSGQFTSNTGGELWLGINDDAVSANPGADNYGSVTAQVTVTPVPEPGVFSLTGLVGGLGLVVARFRKRAIPRA